MATSRQRGIVGHDRRTQRPIRVVWSLEELADPTQLGGQAVAVVLCCTVDAKVSAAQTRQYASVCLSRRRVRAPFGDHSCRAVRGGVEECILSTSSRRSATDTRYGGALVVVSLP